MKHLVMHWFLLRVVGRRILFGYGIVALLSVCVLAALYISSRFALEAYVRDQIGRIPWEIAVLQRGETHRFQDLQTKYRSHPGVREVQGLGFLRLRNLAPLQLEIDKHSAAFRWIAFVAASDEGLLPPELRKTSRAQAPGSIEAALVGAARNDSDSGGRNIQAGAHMRIAMAAPKSLRVLFEGRLANAPPQIDRQDFNRWMLREIGALSYLPEEAIIVLVSPEQFQALATEFHGLILSSQGVHGGDEPPTYVPEMTHLIRLDRQAFVSTWDLDRSLRRLQPEVETLYQFAQDLTPFAWVSSDLARLLARMSEISRLISLATLLVAIPLLWMGWVLARWLGRLLVLDQRRLIGLALLRGISSRQAGRSVLLALLLGGSIGGIAGLLLGTGLPVLGYYLAGRPTPPRRVLLEALAYFGGFLIVGVVLAVLSGWAVLLFVRRLSPREAIASVESEAAAKTANALSWHYLASCLLALVLGSYKIGSWIIGHSLLLSATQADFPPSVVQALLALEAILNFTAVPLLLYGLAGVLLWRTSVVQRAISTVTAPLVGTLDWFVSQYMALRRHRVAQLLFVAGMATSLSLMPQISGDGFYDRLVRGIQTSLGADLLLEFNMQDFGNVPPGPASLESYQEFLQPRLNQTRSILLSDEAVAAAEIIQQYLIPGIYIPGQSGLLLDVIDDPENYLSMVHYEERLGGTRPFSDEIRSLKDHNVLGSQGLFRMRAIPLHKTVILGYDSNGKQVITKFGDSIAFLPGQPALGIEQREGYATAEIDYLNHLLTSDARMVLSRQHLTQPPSLEGLFVLPSRAVFLMKVRDGMAQDDLVARLTKRLPWKPDQFRWETVERNRLGKDMFVSLALENVRIYMIGSVLLACCSVLAIALANFLADKRTFGLLRLRGVAPSLLLKIALSFFLLPILAGILVGIAVGIISGYGLSQAMWDLPRVKGVGSFLANRLTFSLTSGGIILCLSGIFVAVAWSLGSWLFRRTARESIREV